MIRSLLAIAGVFVLFLAALVGLDREPSGAWTPKGYVETADELIAAGYLWMECQDPGTGRVRDSIHTSLPPGSPQAEWFAASYLREDVRRFNTDPEARRIPFLVDGCRLLGVDPYFHRVDLPNRELPRWRGDVRLAGGEAGAALEGTSNQQLLEVRHPRNVQDAGRSERVRLDQGGLTVSAPILRVGRAGSREVSADLFMVGEHLVLADRRDVRPETRIRVQGFATPPGRLVRVEPGDWLQFGYSTGGRERQERREHAYTYLAHLGEQGSVASFVRVQNRDVRRVYPAAALRPLVEPFSQSMDGALYTVAERRRDAAVEYDVHLTLDRELGDRIGADFLRWCARHRLAVRPRAISMLVMDAASGGVRAIPSCPDESGLASFEPLSARERERWTRNQNLVPHPIGSAGKPFWAVAIASRYPAFLDLEVRAHEGGRSSVLGCPITPGYDDHAHGAPGGWVGMEAFVATSCNRYLIDYATAALTLASRTGHPCERAVGRGQVASCFPQPQGGPRDTLRFCDQLVEVVLSPESRLVERGGCGNLQFLETYAPAPSLGAIANLQWYWQGSSRDTTVREDAGMGAEYRSQRYRVDVWRRMLRALEVAGDSSRGSISRLRFAPASPEAANLALNTVEELRADWVNLLLGGENSRWSNFQLAEAMARLMTGHQVVGEFIDSVGMASGEGGSAQRVNARNSFPEIGSELLHPGARRRVLHAMERVIWPGGTASDLGGPVETLRRRLRTVDPRNPYDLYVFAKTGTPNVSVFQSTSQRQVIERLYREGGAVWDAESRRFRNTPAQRRMLATLDARTRRWVREDILQPMEENPELFRQAREADAPDHPLYFDTRGQLRLARDRGLEVTRQGGVLVLGILAVPANRGRTPSRQRADWVSTCELDPGLRDRILEVPPVEQIDLDRSVALTVAIYVDDLNRGQGSGFAIDLARAVFPALSQYLEDEIQRKLR